MNQVLYRKWRPQTWDDVVGQKHVTHTLQNALATGRIAHAYLFSGPRGTGKTSMARILAKAANCSAEDVAARPCNQCARCKAVNEGNYLDLIEIDAASNTSVEDVRDLRERVPFAPGDGRYKVYIIDEVHMLSTAAFNALLKTLEEPPAHAIFILATTEAHKIPATVVSRCQRHEFRRLGVEEITAQLTEMVKAEGIRRTRKPWRRSRANRRAACATRSACWISSGRWGRTSHSPKRSRCSARPAAKRSGLWWSASAAAIPPKGCRSFTARWTAARMRASSPARWSIICAG